MRISEIVDNNKYRDSTELMFFHGTATKHLESFVKRGIGIPKNSRHKIKDFGQGFYITSNYWQAKDYADRIATSTKTDPLILACIIPITQLRQNLDKGLIVDEFNEQWLQTIIRGRFNNEEPLSNDYDWIYGRCGDGHTYTFEKEYRSQEKLDLKSLLPHTIPNKDFPHHQFDQLWLGTKKALNYIKFVEFINKEVVNYEKIPLHD